MTDYYLPHHTIEALLPSPALDRELIPCPECKAEYCIDGMRRGPALIMYASNRYRVVCLSCWIKGAPGCTPEKSISKWNKRAKQGRLLELRTDLGLSQEDLAKLANVSHNSISHIENHHRAGSSEVRQKLALALGVPVDSI